MPESGYVWLNLLILAAFVFLLARASLAAWLRYRGKFLVTCPETKRAAAVEVDTSRAALSALFGSPQLRLDDCSRWSERGPCGQPCLSQLARSPQDCMLSHVVRSWYQNKHCALCGKSFSGTDWNVHQPALLGADGRSVEWRDVPPELLPDFFLRFRPLCWDCHIVETFRRERPDLVIDNRAGKLHHQG